MLTIILYYYDYIIVKINTIKIINQGIPLVIFWIQDVEGIFFKAHLSFCPMIVLYYENGIQTLIFLSDSSDSKDYLYFFYNIN